MNSNNSLGFLNDNRSSGRGLIRANQNRSTISAFGDGNAMRKNQTMLLNNSVSYIPNEVYLGEQTLSNYDISMSAGKEYSKMDDVMIKSKTDQLYDLFLDVVRIRTNDTEIFETIQDLIQVCSDTFNDIVQNGGRLNEKNIFDSFGWLNQERNTWKLLFCLYKDRLLQQRENEEVDIDDLWLHSSEKEIIDKLYEKNANLREYQLIVDWLEQCDFQQHFDKCRHFMDETISWENTLHQLQNVDKTVFGSGKEIVKSLDPDAPHRENKPLHDLDMEDESRIAKEILFEIRQGRLDEAGALCERVGQYWRAAILEGWRLHHDPNYAETQSSSEKYPIEGNPRRDLWKKLAWQMAENKKLNEFTRAYLGVFCGHLESLLNPLSNSWFDLLWAYLKVQIDIRVESELRSVSTTSYLDMPQKYWDNKMTLEGIFDELNAHKNASVRNIAKHHMTIIRKYIILDDIPELMRNVITWIDDIKNNGHFLRFITHIILFMRQIDRRHQDDIAEKVIQTYVEFLIQEIAEPSLIAFYTAALPAKQQIELYAKYLECVNETSQRKLALEEAFNCGLDVDMITDHAVHTIRLKNPSIDSERPLTGTITALDEEKISSLEWLSFNPDQCGELLWHTNALVRLFLGENNVEGVRKALKMIPQNIVSQIYSNHGGKDNLPALVECSIHEYLCHVSHLVAQESYNDWLSVFHNKPKEPTLVSSNAHFTERMASEHKEQAYINELERWKLNLMELTQITMKNMMHVLTFPEKGYLVDPDTAQTPPDDSRLAMENRFDQLVGLRKLVIPQLILLLHSVLHSSGDYKGAVSLADEIASENWQLYQMYSKHELTEILGKISESSLALMNEKMDPWGYSMNN